MRELDIWYVSSLRLCNFDCDYCVSTGEFAKSRSEAWRQLEDQSDFQRIARWIGTRSHTMGVRLASLGEPLTSKRFLSEVSWLSNLENIRFVELLTNGSLLKSRLPKLAQTADLTKISLWVTYHHTEIDPVKLVENVRFAQEKYGCFSVLNALLFPDNTVEIARIRDLAREAGIRFNLDLGYDVSAGHFGRIEDMVPILQLESGREQALELGVDPAMLDVNTRSLQGVRGQPCSAGSDFVFIWIDGDVYPCSRYANLGIGRLGNVLDPDFELELRAKRWEQCRSEYGCCNKEDFLHLRMVQDNIHLSLPSLGWTANAERHARPLLNPKS